MAIAIVVRRLALALTAGLSSTTDKVLVGCGLATAGSSVFFASFMLVQGDHPPRVNGIQHLAIFAQPNSSSRSASIARMRRAADPILPSVDLDMSPTGTIARRDKIDESDALAPLEKAFSVSRDSEADIRWNGRWIAAGDDRNLQSSRTPTAAEHFSRKMIFDSPDD